LLSRPKGTNRLNLDQTQCPLLTKYASTVDRVEESRINMRFDRNKGSNVSTL
jgi:hypothetical protein